ncbi:MAG TPA: hypothetical protein VJU84_13150 [Pyrinomonadaceae bacterium]|nr:hypothetical protein [Pyrinomonadaceae bacterium]
MYIHLSANATVANTHKLTAAKPSAAVTTDREKEEIGSEFELFIVINSAGWKKHVRGFAARCAEGLDLHGSAA